MEEKIEKDFRDRKGGRDRQKEEDRERGREINRERERTMKVQTQKREEGGEGERE